MNEIRQNSLKAWFLAARPKTLTGAAVPVIIGLALAARDCDFHLNWIPAVLCMLFAFVMQIDANFVNDYFDWKKGNDDEATRLGPLRACSQGWVTPRAMVIAMIVTTLLGCCIGLPLVWYGGWEMILVGIACVVFCFLYTTCLSYLGLGDVLVLVFFGLVPTCLTYYLQTDTITLPVVWASLACGLAIDNLLIVNNYRDIDNDRRDGKRTLIVRIGKKWAERLYLFLGICAVTIIYGLQPNLIKLLLLLVYLVFHVRSSVLMTRLKGRSLNKVLGETARNNLIFGIVTAIYLVW